MSLLQFLPILDYLVTAAVVLLIAAGRKSASQGLLIILAIGFTGFTLLTLWQEGLTMFWINHTSSLSGVQVWFDLLISVALSFALIAPSARAVGMPLLPWALAVLATASVALLPMIARTLWLETRRG